MRKRQFPRCTGQCFFVLTIHPRANSKGVIDKSDHVMTNDQVTQGFRKHHDRQGACDKNESRGGGFDKITEGSIGKKDPEEGEE